MAIRLSSGRTGVFITDPQLRSTIRAIADANGQAANQEFKTYDISPWGAVAADTGTTTRLRLAGQQYDQGSRLYYMRARYYDPDLGRFLSEDPIGIGGGLNLYAYAGNDPINNADPSGLDFQCRWFPGEQLPGSFGTGPAVGGEQPPVYVNSVPSRTVCLITPPAAPSVGGDPGSGGKGGGGQEPGGRPKPKKCVIGPLDVGQNMNAARGLASAFWLGVTGGPLGAPLAAAAASRYTGLVETGGPWDSKTTIGPTPTNVAAGNINFGATCSQFGLGTWLGGQFCQFGAGLYGKATGNYGSPLFSQYHGDIPSDNQQIRQGLSLAKKGGC